MEKQEKNEFITAIIPAAGRGSRMNHSINKQYIELEQKPILAHTLSVFDKCRKIDEIIIVVATGEDKILEQMIFEKYKFKTKCRVVVGGATRQESVYNALLKVDSKCTMVAVHDGARPLITVKDILKSIKGAKDYGGCVLAVPVTATMKKADKEGFVEETIERSLLYNIQTPQTFEYGLLIKAYDNASKEGIVGTDDSYLVEMLGHKVKIVNGSYNNIKITTPEDLIYAQEFISYRT